VPSRLCGSSRHRVLLTGVSAPRRYGAVGQRRHHRLARPSQCLSTSQAFRLTPGRTWRLTHHLICTLRWRAPRSLRARCPTIYLVSAGGGGARMCCPHGQHESREGACVRATFRKSLASKCPACGRHPLPEQPFAITVNPSSRKDDCCRTLPAGTSTVDAPGIPPLHLTEELLASCAAPGRNARRARRCSLMSRLRWSCWPTGTCERHGTRWPSSWGVRLKNGGPSALAPSAYRATWPTVRGISMRAGPLPGRRVQARGPYLRISSMACAMPRRPGDRPHPPQLVGRPYGYAQYGVGPPARQCPPWVHIVGEDSGWGHWVALFDRTTRDRGHIFNICCRRAAWRFP
jgi:hypothetical protein